MPEKFYLTTAITYASKKPHVGNVYEFVLSDAIVRFKRMQGFDVFFLTGTDEHGQKIEDVARENGRTPKEHADIITQGIKDTQALINISYNKFIRTTDDYHEKAVQRIFRKLYDQGDIYKGEYKGLYCVACESFYTESQLIDGRCPDCGREVKPAREEAYFFKMSKYQDRLMKYIEENPDFIRPESRKREMINNFLKPGLQDLCVSRSSFKWGIPVDFDPGHVVYVWVDALSNYITALGYSPETPDAELYKKYWPADVHVIGKDILRFHTIYWPIILMALGEPLPKSVFGHPWMLMGADKMSKSTGNVLYTDDLVKIFGTDAIRWYMLSAMPYAQDGSITIDDVVSLYNSDLANNLGNLVNRTVSMQNQYFGGAVQAPSGEETPEDKDLRETAKAAVGNFAACLNDYHTADAIREIVALARRCNKYIDETMPWVLAKNEAGKTRLGAVLYNLLENIRKLAIMLSPLIPETAAKIFEQIGAGGDIQTWASAALEDGIKPGGKVGAAAPLFSRLKEKETHEAFQALTDKAEAPALAAKAAKAELVDISDFAKLSLVCAEIKTCEPVPKSDKLYKLRLDDGQGGRQLVSGIAKWYTPEDLIGRKIILIANLKPAKLRGVVSEGMLLAADAGDAASVVFLDESVPVGAKIR
ncbi:MAG: methionine--tRNA ligase [Oscillospiraceae bacterium]|jgi:methionyl-tRNA synthetase|nr:methionine--tRNA ligase [Oscillospiraceae bacterium]